MLRKRINIIVLPLSAGIFVKLISTTPGSVDKIKRTLLDMKLRLNMSKAGIVIGVNSIPQEVVVTKKVMTVLAIQIMEKVPMVEKGFLV